VWGVVRIFIMGEDLKAVSSTMTIEPEHGLAVGASFAFVFLLVRAFSSGCAALTGVEAISNGVPAFKPPKSRNAATTLLMLGVIAISMMAGIILLARETGLQYVECFQVNPSIGCNESQIVGPAPWAKQPTVTAKGY